MIFMTRKWEPVEHRLVAEFVTKMFPGQRFALRVRLGTVPEKYKKRYGDQFAERWFKVTKKWADAVVFKNDEIIIIEAKVFGKYTAVYQLTEYAKLFYETPEYLSIPFRILLK